MMMTLLLLKSRIQSFYEKHYRIVRGIIKLLAVFASLLLIVHPMDYSGWLGSYWVLIPVAVLCSVTPDLVSAIVLFMAIGLESLAAVPVMGILFFLVLIIYFLLFGRMGVGQPYMMLVIPILSLIHMESVVPVLAALFVSPVVIPSMLMGIVIQFTMKGITEYVNTSAGVTSVSSPDEALLPLRYMIDYLAHNRVITVMFLAFGITFLCIYFIRRTSIRHASQIAILVGTLLYLAAELWGGIMMNLDIDPLWSILQALAAMAVAYIAQFFRLTLDYHGTRKLQFEDDEYYYYVTAIPKYKVAVVDKTVTRIVPDEAAEPVDIKEELEKTLEEEKDESDSDWL